MTETGNELDPIDPSTARELYLEHKKTHCTDATVTGHRYRSRHLVNWCDENGIHNLNELTGRDLHEFRLWHMERNDIKKIRHRQHMWTLRVFLKWAASIEAVPANLYDKVMVPDINRDQRQSEEMLEGDTAEDILEYLSRYHYASRRHVIISLLWETGIRIGAAISIDREEMYLKDGYIDLVHRPDEGTTLKNGKGGERPIAITEGLSELLEEYIENNRLASVDDYGRHPLITGRFGRLTRTSYRRAVYQTTAPWFRGQSCPGCIDDPKKAVRRQSILMRFGAAV